MVTMVVGLVDRLVMLILLDMVDQDIRFLAVLDSLLFFLAVVVLLVLLIVVVVVARCTDSHSCLGFW